MPNYCNYEMKIKGSKRAIERVMGCLKATYDYYEGKPSHKHFFRSYVDYENETTQNEDGTFSKIVLGACAWSVKSCMCTGWGTYYEYAKKEHKDIFMGTSLKEQSRGCEIEVFGEEPGVGFSEHLIFKNGKCLCNEVADVEPAGYDENYNVTTDIDWDTYDGDVLCSNPFREDKTQEYAWEI